MRKANETNPPKPRPQMPTPQEFSRLKHERQIRMEETARQQLQYRQQVIQQQKVSQFIIERV